MWYGEGMDKRDELRELDEAIAATEQAAEGADNPFPWELSLAGLRSQRARLVAEVEHGREE